MAVYKDKERGTWYCKFYYTNWQGQKKQKLKRGFKLQREANEWESLFLEQFAKNPDISFETLYSKYWEYISHRVKASTLRSRKYMLSTHVLPYFKDQVVSEITPEDITHWQNWILSKDLSESYQKSLNIYLKAIFSYAVDFLGLSKNPCTKPIGRNKRKRIDFWTPEEYKQFAESIKDNVQYYTLFEILYYTGMRIGEAQALTFGDIDMEEKVIHITKTYFKPNGEPGVLQTAKTECSCRDVDIPDFLVDEIKEYKSHIYAPTDDMRLFQRELSVIRAYFKNHIKKCSVKDIRIHDLRHSHASVLINLGANPVLVAERLGHESASITLDTYSHLFPKAQSDIVAKIEKL